MLPKTIWGISSIFLTVGAVLFFKGESPEAAERFARADPYVRNGLVTNWRVRPWTTAVGEAATAPLRPLP